MQTINHQDKYTITYSSNEYNHYINDILVERYTTHINGLYIFQYHNYTIMHFYREKETIVVIDSVTIDTYVYKLVNNMGIFHKSFTDADIRSELSDDIVRGFTIDDHSGEIAIGYFLYYIFNDELPLNERNETE
jgi:hypothetical protein